MRTTDCLTPFEAAGILEPLDVELARRLGVLAREAQASEGRDWSAGVEDLLGLAMACRAPRLGHVCFDLAQAGQGITARFGTDASDFGRQSGEGDDGLVWPDPDQWIRALSASPLVRSPDQDLHTPLVMENGGRLYLDRYWHYEQMVAARILQRVQEPVDDVDLDLLKEGLHHVLYEFRDGVGPGIQGQRVAAMLAVLRRFAILSGGPGTGKTATVTAILVLLISQAQARIIHHEPAATAATGPSTALWGPPASCHVGYGYAQSAVHPTPGSRTGFHALATARHELSGLARRLDAPLRIQLVAPTGKAAARMAESIREGLDRLRARLGEGLLGPRFDPRVLDLVPVQATTIHRALGANPERPGAFRYHRANPLPTDLVVVDEASMIDVSLMARLLDAVPPEARLILLGDRNQLASVECGAVLGDLCGVGSKPVPGVSLEVAALARDLLGVESRDPTQVEPAVPTEFMVPVSREGPAIRDAVMHLSFPIRFQADSGIARAARAIQDAGTPEGLAFAVRLITQDARVDAQGTAPLSDLAWVSLGPGDDMERLGGAAAALIRRKMVQGYAPVLTEAIAAMGAAGNDPEARRMAADRALKAFDSYRILCTHRHGPRGVETVNRLVRDWLSGALDIGRGDWYSGRPVMVLRNDYHVGLFNGDIGLVLPDPARDNELLAFFPGPQEGQVRALPQGKLPPHETVFAMTVHKSQGSQFDDVLVLLPARESALVTRELIYTAVTRARSRVTLAGSPEVLRAAIAMPVRRASGLRDKVWGAG
jgi:exodeoxyribonuclease V alpha subunit